MDPSGIFDADDDLDLAGVGQGEFFPDMDSVLANPRESARQSRQRKKAFNEFLESRIAELTAAIDQAQQERLQHGFELLDDGRRRFLAQLEALAVKEVTSEEEQRMLASAAQLVEERYGLASLEAQAILEHHLDGMVDQLVPDHLKLPLWTVFRPSEVFEEPAGQPAWSQADEVTPTMDSRMQAGSSAASQVGAGSPAMHSLWTLLCAELGMTTEQAGRLQSSLRALTAAPSRPNAPLKLARAVLLNRRLRDVMTARAAAVDDLGGRLLSVLRPDQALRYLAWLERNRARLQQFKGARSAATQEPSGSH